MAGLSERRVEQSDYGIIRLAITAAVERAKQKSDKLWVNFIDMECAMQMVYGRDTAYIVDGCLVVYDVIVPEYTTQSFLQEVLVCRLERGSFDSVSAFLIRKAKEAGCAAVSVGTALAWDDSALASLYMKEGFTVEAVSLVKVI